MADTETRPIAAAELPSLLADLEAYAHVFLAVSGGADSTALMHLTAQWLRAAGAGVADRRWPAVTVLTVDHGLRPEAAEEAAAVAVQAESLGFAAHVLAWSGSKPDSGVQDAARTARYDLMTQQIMQVVPDPSKAALVTAHHRDDTCETLLMRLARGAGVDGLAGIPAHGCWQGIGLLRPLLDVPEARLRATLEAADISWAEDPSNQDRQFERVRLRAATAARAELGLDDAALSLTAKRLARARRALEAMTDAWLRPRLEAPALRHAGIFVWPAEAGSGCHSGLGAGLSAGTGALEDEIAVRALMRVLPAIGGVQQPPRLLRVERLWDDMQHSDFAGSTLGNCIVRRESGGDIHIFREPARSELPEIETQPGTAAIWDNRFEIKSAQRLRVRPLKAGDLEALACRRGPQQLPYPLDALQATPVVADAEGVLAIPALNLHREGAYGLTSNQLTCRFLCERLNRAEIMRTR